MSFDGTPPRALQHISSTPGAASLERAIDVDSSAVLEAQIGQRHRRTTTIFRPENHVAPAEREIQFAKVTFDGAERPAERRGALTA